MVGTCIYVVLFSSSHLDISLVALHTLSYLLLSSPLSNKCYFSSETSASLCLHTLCSFSIKLYHLRKAFLFCSHSLLFFFSICLQLYHMLNSCLLPIQIGTGNMTQHYLLLGFGIKIKSIGRRGLYPYNKWYEKYPV